MTDLLERPASAHVTDRPRCAAFTVKGKACQAWPTRQGNGYPFCASHRYAWILGLAGVQ